MFLWTWDARPYPAWPHTNIWQDGYLWEKGHWVNSKFGACSLAAIILELSYKSGIDLAIIDVTSLDESVEGFVQNKAITSIDAINYLRILYFFDIVANDRANIKFIKRGLHEYQTISSDILVKLTANSYLSQTQISPKNIISKLELTFIDRYSDYRPGFCRVNNERDSYKPVMVLKLPIILSNLEMVRLGNLILKNAATEDKVIKFNIPTSFIKYEPSDFIKLDYLNYQYQIRIISISFSRYVTEITGIIDDVQNYYLPALTEIQQIKYLQAEEIKCVILDHFDLPFIANGQKSLAIYLHSSTPQHLYASIDNDKYDKISELNILTNIGSVTTFENSPPEDILQPDKLSKLIIKYLNFELIVRAGWNYAMVGQEIIKFQNWQKTSKNTYLITTMQRGNFSTERFIKSTTGGQRFLMLETNVNIIPISPELLSKDIYFKVGDLKPWKMKFEG